MEIQEHVNNPIKLFHWIAHKHWWWAYKWFEKDLQQEAELCKLLYGNLDVISYRNKCMHHIRKLLKGLGWREAQGNFDCYLNWPEPQKGLDQEDLIFLQTIEKMYQNGYDYIKICTMFDNWDMNLWIEVRGLLKACFTKEKKRINEKARENRVVENE